MQFVDEGAGLFKMKGFPDGLLHIERRTKDMLSNVSYDEVASLPLEFKKAVYTQPIMQRIIEVYVLAKRE